MMITGYTNGYFDLFHVGHLNLIKRASKLCDRLIVGVISDQECLKNKGYLPVIPIDQRLKIVSNIYRVAVAVPVFDDNKILEWEKYKFKKLFVGTDHKGSELWTKWEARFKLYNVDVIYLPYTKEVSTTTIKEKIICQSSEKNQ